MLSAQDKAEFALAMQGVRRLGACDRMQQTPRVLVAKQPPQPPRPKINFVLSDHPSSLVSSADTLAYRTPGVVPALWRQMQAGQFAVQISLDLHGLTLAQALLAVQDCFAQARRRDYQWVLLIHGKGYGSDSKPVLKNGLNQWLPLQQQVRAFHSASPRCGGTGALVVLLQRQRLTSEGQY